MIQFGIRGTAVAFLACAVAFAGAQTPQSLQDLVRIARARNGTILASKEQVVAAAASVDRSRAGFFPTLTPNFQYDLARDERHTGNGRGGFDTAGTTLNVVARYLILDNGARRLGLSTSQLNLSSAEASALQTERATITAVTQQYYDVLRADEQLQVNRAQLTRAETILRQTEARADTGDIARKDILQARADFFNAQVAVLQSESNRRVAMADLKALTGWDTAQDGELALASPGQRELVRPVFSLADALAEGLANRPDLAASRTSLQAQRNQISLNKLDAGISYDLSAQYTRGFARDVFDRSGLVLSASLPLFDAGLSRANVRAARAQFQQAEVRLNQDERDARAEIEGAYETYVINLSRLEAATLARQAAQLNFDAAVAAQREGAANLPEVVNAQTSLITAENNYVQAVFDTFVSEIRLNFVVGRPIFASEPTP